MTTDYDKQIDDQKLSDAEAVLLAEAEAKAKAKAEEELQTYWDAEKAAVEKVLKVLRAIFGNLANIADIVNRYAGITSVVATSVSLASMFPVVVLGPIGAMFHLILALSKHDASLANKLVNFFTTTGSSGTSIASVFLHSIALPLIMVSASLSLIKESWGLGELLYRKYYKKETVTSLEMFDAVQGVVLAAISVFAASLLFFPPAIPFAYGLFALMGVYKFLDSVGKNPVKMLFNLYDKESDVTQPVKGSTEKMQAKLASSPDEFFSSGNSASFKLCPRTLKNASRLQEDAEKAEERKIPAPLRIQSRYSPGFYTLPKSPTAPAHSPVASSDYSISLSHHNDK